MTRKDFERIARVLGYCEQHCDSDEEMALVHWVAEKFADDLASDHPRFKRATFMAAAQPIHSAETKRAILAQVSSERLEYLRRELRAERISYAELAELQSLTEYIDLSDVELREAAGLPED